MDDFPVFRLKDLSAQDYHTYLHDCFVRCQTPKDETMDWKYLSMVQGVGLEAEAFLQAFDKKPTSFKIKDLKFDFRFPEPGVYDFKETTIIFTRRPRRQWIRGLNYTNTLFSSPLHTLYYWHLIHEDVFQRNKFEWNCSNLNQIFLLRSKPNPTKAIEAIHKDKALMRALNRDFSISQGVFSDKPSIWMWTQPIGELENDKVKLFDNVFAEETKDFFGALSMEVFVEKDEDKKHAASQDSYI